MRLINQPNNYGCVLASIAMVSGKTYTEIEYIYGKPAIGEGFNFTSASYVLNYLGYYTRFVSRINHKKQWPINTNLAIWSININGQNHAVVQNKDKIYDPAENEIKTINEYPEPNDMLCIIAL